MKKSYFSYLNHCIIAHALSLNRVVECIGGKTMKNRIYNVDIFVLFNSILFFFMAKMVYYDRFILYRGVTNIHEFFFYAVVIYAVMFFFWIQLRHVEIPKYILFLFEVMILLHFSAAFIMIDGHRLYDFRFEGIRFDKVVHFTNAFIGTVITLYFFKKNHCDISTKFIMMMTVFVVLGIGAIIEIAEFIVVMTVPHNGVGAYTNNMLDLVANFIGSVLSILLVHFFTSKTAMFPETEKDF